LRHAEALKPRLDLGEDRAERRRRDVGVGDREPTTHIDDLDRDAGIL
jgi:hypothetical protein